MEPKPEHRKQSNPVESNVSGAHAVFTARPSGPAPRSAGVSGAAAAMRHKSGVGADKLRDLPAVPTRQFDLCVLTPVVPEKLAELRSVLARLREETNETMLGRAPDHPLLDWAALGSVHFARFVIFDADPVGTGSVLAFSTNYDGPLGESRCSRKRAQAGQIEQLVEVAGNALDTIYRCCEGYSGLNNLVSYIEAHVRPAAAFYVGSSGRPRDQVLAEAELRERVHAILDELHRTEPDLDPQTVRQRVLADAAIAELKLPTFAAQPNRKWRVVLVVGAVVVGLGAVLLGLFSGILPLQVISVGLLGGLGFGALWLRHLEKTDAQFQPRNSKAEREHIEWASTDENLFLQNQLTHLVAVKPGMFRRFSIRAVMFAIQLLARNVYNKGKLGNIPSIHFARWCLIDAGRRVIFFSNFDNSWESYLGDFIDQASSGLTGVWSNTVEYPRTKWLIHAGSHDASRFKAWTRHYQIPTQVWYSAYPQLSIRNVNANTEIRRGLSDPEAMSASVWLDWLQGVDRAQVDAEHAAERAKPTLELAAPSAAASPKPTLDLSDIQGLLLRGYGPKQGAEYLMLEVGVGRARAARQWLASLPLTSAEHGARERGNPDPFLNVAFTHPGLAALELEPELLDDFPIAFVQGAAHETRCRQNGDVGDNAPTHWTWGAGERPVHVLLMVYATTLDAARTHAERLSREAEQAGLTLVKALSAGRLPGRKEHFGFRDGIAQPVVRGSGKEETPYNAVLPGEFLLGYRDEYGNDSYCPTASGRPNFSKNGSYLVFRQLEQKVESFWQFCQKQGAGVGLDPVAVAAKLVGRWPSGAPLVKHPKADPQSQDFQDEDGFAYLATGKSNDRDGAACPLGAHVRRTNPRDWESGATRLESVTIANRHRIIRRGRPYGDLLTEDMSPEALLARSRNPDQAPERGLQFLAFCADLERQFEFVQQQWSQNFTFAGLNAAPDPINGTSLAREVAAACSFTIQKDAKQSSFGRCVGLADFIRVRGSAYFFMPSLSAVAALKPKAEAPSEGANRLAAGVTVDE